MKMNREKGRGKEREREVNFMYIVKGMEIYRGLV